MGPYFERLQRVLTLVRGVCVGAACGAMNWLIPLLFVQPPIFPDPKEIAFVVIPVFGMVAPYLLVALLVKWIVMGVQEWRAPQKATRTMSANPSGLHLNPM